MLPRKRANPSSRACLPCRDKHLKCDGQTPVCRRCEITGLECVFVQSRRGRRAGSSTAMLQMPLPATPSSPGGSQRELPNLTIASFQPQNTIQQRADDRNKDIFPLSQIADGSADDHYFIGLYYRFIHPAHPFLLPQKLYQQNQAIFPDHLKRSICFISCHHTSACQVQLRDASNAVFEPGVVHDAFMVQSLLLVTLASYARFERDRGHKALNTAIDVAYEIGLDSDNFRSDDDPLVRESWRRTWWELYTTTGLISLIGGTDSRLNQPAHMNLPCECEDYDFCQTPRMGNVEEMKQRFLAETPTKWSSFAYKVEATRILAMVLDANSGSLYVFSPEKQAGEAAVSSYLLSLPSEKREGLRADGEIDEVMSCALMIIHLASICLHLPLSSLAHVGDYKTVCGTGLTRTVSESPNMHKSAALRSAKALARLLTIHPSLTTLSPCFSCAMAFSSVVLLSEYSVQKQPKPPYLSETLQLELSALHSLGDTWPIARVVRSQIAGFARDVMGKSSSSNYVETMPDLEMPSLDDQWLQDLISEDMILPGGDLI